MSNQERGYIDPSVTVLIAAVGGIVFGGPLLVETLGSGMPSATRILVGGAVVVLMHTYAISFAVHEAHWEAHSRFSGGEWAPSPSRSATPSAFGGLPVRTPSMAGPSHATVDLAPGCWPAPSSPTALERGIRPERGVTAANG